MSPIRASERPRYPADWPAISRAIKADRAGWRCECVGECGRGTHDGRCPNRHGEPAYGTGSRVVLTTAHLDHTPENCAPENLRAMCQGCHLHYDREHHAQTRAATRGRAGADPLATRVTVRVDDDVLAAVDARAADDARGRSDWLRLAIAYAVATMPEGWHP